MTSPTVLISGAGVAGPTLAFWLARHGFRPTVVERAQGQRSSGNPVDVRGPALSVAEQMGVLPQLRDVATRTTTMSLVNADGRPIARVRLGGRRNANGNREVEIPRGDLAAVLYRAAQARAEFLFDDTITALRQDGTGVDVTFDRAAPRRFDLVVGADGLHSTVRRLAFGPESDFIRHLGLYVATLPYDGLVDDPSQVLLYNTPGRLLSIHPGRGDALAAFIFRHGGVSDFDYRDTEQHKRIVSRAYAGNGWRTPEILERLDKADDLYFDSVSQVRLPRWSTGRVVLLGDAASCVSLLGDGSSLAMAGAFALAEALAAHPGRPGEAFRAYEAQHRLLVEQKQRQMGPASAILVPRTRFGIAVRNLAARAWPGAA